MCGISWRVFDMTDEQITAPNPAERLRVMIDLLGDGGHGCFKKTSLCAILAHIDAQAAEIARLQAALNWAAQETQP
jgi:hypothetical protein